MDNKYQPQSQIDISRFNLLIVGVLLTVLSLFIVVQTMRGGMNSLITAIVLIGGIIWIVGGRNVWWLPIPIAVSFGGLVWVGLRIYTHELAVLMAVAALFPALALNYRSVECYRGSLPWYVYALSIYMVAHLAVSMLLDRYIENTGYGNIMRTYMNALWALFFLLTIFHYGKTTHLRSLLLIVYFGLFFRVAIGIYSYYFPGFLFFRGFNVFFLLSQYGSVELRGTALQLFIFALGLSAASRRVIPMIAHLVVALLSVWLLPMGSGRAAIIMMGIIPILWLLVQRRYGLLFSLIGGMIAVIAFINANPDVLYHLPRAPRRALSVLVLKDVLDIQAENAGSDLWHQMLFNLGKDRWLASGLTFFFGNRVHPLDPTMQAISWDMHYAASIAASITRYESALWTILATTGVVGITLYAATFIKLLNMPVRLLFREQFADATHVVYFVATAQCLLYILFLPISGTFPGIELMWATIAFTLYRDKVTREEKSKQTTQADKPPHQIIMVN